MVGPARAARAPLALALLCACRNDVVVVVRGSLVDATFDATPDATFDAAPDAAPDAVSLLTREERLGMHTSGVAVIADGVDDARAIRFVYVGDDGQLHVERRLSETLARACEQALAPPAGFTLASAPASSAQRGMIVVAARDGADAIRYHALHALPEAGPCGAALSAWELLPEATRGVRFRSSPAVLQSEVNGMFFWTVSALASDGGVWSTTRHVGPSGAWTPWTRWPALPTGEEAVSAPSLDHEGADGVHLFVVTEDARGQRRQRVMSWFLPARIWRPAWREEDAPGADFDAAISQRVFEIEPSYRQGPSPYGLWRALRAVDGTVWTQSLFQRPGFAHSWTAWQSFGRPFADLRAKSSAPVIAPRRDARTVSGELLFLSVALNGPAVVRYTSAWSYEPVDPPGQWREAPDRLR